jgi:hypothetical protein
MVVHGRNIHLPSHTHVRDMELEFAFQYWDELKSSTEMQEMIVQVARGALPHAADILGRLLEK